MGEKGDDAAVGGICGLAALSGDCGRSLDEPELRLKLDGCWSLRALQPSSRSTLSFCSSCSSRLLDERCVGSFGCDCSGLDAAALTDCDRLRPQSMLTLGSGLLGRGAIGNGASGCSRFMLLTHRRPAARCVASRCRAATRCSAAQYDAAVAPAAQYDAPVARRRPAVNSWTPVRCSASLWRPFALWSAQRADVDDGRPAPVHRRRLLRLVAGHAWEMGCTALPYAA